MGTKMRRKKKRRFRRCLQFWIKIGTTLDCLIPRSDMSNFTFSGQNAVKKKLFLFSFSDNNFTISCRFNRTHKKKISVIYILSVKGFRPSRLIWILKQSIWKTIQNYCRKENAQRQYPRSIYKHNILCIHVMCSGLEQLGLWGRVYKYDDLPISWDVCHIYSSKIEFAHVVSLRY